MARQGQVPFVGRERERDLLAGRLRAALDGEGQVVLVAGEPGVGKTRLAQETADRVAELGIRSVWGRATEEEGSPPYWPFRQVLRTLGGMPALDAPHDLQERFRLFEAVLEALVAGAESGGLLVVLDDLQWADSASVRLLVHLAMGMAGSRLVVLATYRDTETAVLGDALAALAREPLVTRVRLGGLSEADVAAQLAGVTGWAVPDSVAAAVCRRTRGNPFFVGELGRLLADSPDGDGGELPDGVRDAVRGRLARLSPGCRSVVATAAVLGSEPDPAALVACTGSGLAEVLAALDEAAAAGIVSTVGGAGRFAHDLIREAARLEVATAERLVLHQRMAEHLAGRPDADLRAAEVAFHLLESLPAGDAALAVSWAERAAAQAVAQLAWEQAAALYGRALSAGASLTPADRCRLLLAATRAKVRAYDLAGARQSLLATADIARGAGDAETLAHAALTMEGVTDFLWDATGRTLCDEALAGLPEGDSALRARLLAQVVVADSWRPVDDAEGRSAEALAMAERVGDRRAIVEASRARQMARSGPDGATDRLALGDRLVKLGADGDDDTALWGRLWRYDALVQLGEIDQAEAELGSVDALAERLRSPLARWHALRCRAAMTMARGRFAEAEQLGEQSVALARRAGHEGTLVPSLGFLVGLRTQTGEVKLDELLESHANASVVAALRGLYAWWMAAVGRREEALRLYRTMPPLTAMPPFMLLPALAGTAELAAEFDDKQAAAEVYRLLSPHADLTVCGGAGVIMILGSARTGLGITATVLGRLDDAVRHLRAAVATDTRIGLPPAAATATYHLAAVLARRRRPGDREEAGALAVSAAATAQRLGMVPLHRNASELVAALSGSGGGPLTRREREIAELVSRGLTNRQIAAAAHISERTAETHVQHILAKLGFASRAQIATWVVTGQQMSTGPT